MIESLYKIINLAAVSDFRLMPIFLKSRSHYPWPDSPDCKDFKTTFNKDDPIPRISLASFPNSGNTWLRYLIEGLTGIYTGSFYLDMGLTKKGK